MVAAKKKPSKRAALKISKMVDINKNPKLKLIALTCCQLVLNLAGILVCTIILSLDRVKSAEQLIFVCCLVLCLIALFSNCIMLYCFAKKTSSTSHLRHIRIIMIVGINLFIFFFIGAAFYLFITFGRRWKEIKSFVPHAIILLFITFVCLLINSFVVYYLELVLKSPESREVYYSA